MREACLTASDPTLGAQFGMAYSDAPSLSAYIGSNSATLREAILSAGRFFRLSDPTTIFDLLSTEDGATLSVGSTLAGLRSNDRYQEFLVFGTLARIQSISQRTTRPQKVVFQHRLLGELRDFERIAGGPVRFGGSFTGLKFSLMTLDTRLARFDPDLLAHLTDLAEAQLTHHGAQDRTTRDRVERMLLDALPGRFLTADEVSSNMGTTRRTLTRRLSAEGVTFRSLCNDLRFRLAKAYLQEGRTVTETAFLLGYGEQATFSSAFRGWSGVSPTEFAATAEAT
ncbi:AraC-type DNA-binding protein [Shimia haliotis]|uniref:AraC-type DNA-binding protein n=1 Tax=Shimia haliotis TaxID=1280847 RepID=A0A1I4H3Z2_9RHOB|nr:AraC-type DNA-binding protein [Shimia haliotis]